MKNRAIHVGSDGWVVPMMDKVWTRINAKRPKGKKLFKILGIISGIIWVVALGAVFALKDKKIPKGIAAAAGAKTEMLNAHGLKSEPSDEGKSDATASEGISAEEKKAADEARSGHEGGSAPLKEAAAEASEEGKHAAPTSAEEMPTREEWLALKQVAELRAGAGELEKAVEPLRRVLAMPTRDADLLTLATTVFLGTAHYHEALQTAEQALALKPSDMGLEAQAIDATYRLGQVEKAFAKAKAALKEHPNNLGLLIQTGTMEVEMGPGFADYGKSLQAALKLKPDYQPALYLLGRKAQLEGNYKDAEIAFQKVLKLDPKCAKAYGQLGMALYHQGKEPEALRQYEAELALNPDDYNTWFNVGELHLNQASREFMPAPIQAFRAQAMECFLKTLELNPQHAQAQYRVGVLLNGNGQFKEAIRHLEAALRLDSQHVPTLVQLALAYENLKQPERAKEFLTKAYELDPLNKVVLFKLKQWS